MPDYTFVYKTYGTETWKVEANNLAEAKWLLEQKRHWGEDPDSSEVDSDELQTVLEATEDGRLNELDVVDVEVTEPVKPAGEFEVDDEEPPL